MDLRAEPRSESKQATSNGFAQFDQSTCHTLRSGCSSLPLDSMIEVKCCSLRFWSDVEAELYGSSEHLGSHNQTFNRAYSYAAGAAQAANWTEVMNLFADVLGFADTDPSKPR